MLAAIYFTNHDYLKNDAFTLNFGGEFLYEIKIEKANYIVTRVTNPKYIPDFFTTVQSEIAIKNVSAIVGQNGVGKSSILNVIRSNFIENKNALPKSKSLLIIEKNSKLYYHANFTTRVYLSESGKRIKLPSISKSSLQTIYYSPHLDLNFDPRVDEVDTFDISLDKYIELDLINLEQRGTNEYGVQYPVKQELLFKNAERQILFLSSGLVVEREIFKNIFDFPTHGNAVLEFRETIYDKELRNVPAAFINPLEALLAKIKKELNDLPALRRTSEPTSILTTQLEVNRYLLQRNILRQLLSVMIYQMDVSNDYRDKGKFDSKRFNSIKGITAYQLFLNFLECCLIPTQKGEISPFSLNLVERLIDKIYNVSDEISDERFIKANQLTVSAKDAIEILDFQKEVILDISNYFNKGSQRDSTDFSRLHFIAQGFIFYSPAQRKLSSGENAVLNLFSKLYHFLGEKVSPHYNRHKNVKTYLLLLDEADLGYHPVWKKKFVLAMISTLPYFFEDYRQKPDLQIIFTTHDPLTLSDLPSTNVVYLVNNEGKVRTPNKGNLHHTFGANITDLLSDSFFVQDGLMGDFAKLKIKNAIEWLELADKQEAEKYKKIIEIIDEPIVKRKLAEMYDEKMNEDLEIQLIEKQIEELEILKAKKRNVNDRHI